MSVYSPWIDGVFFPCGFFLTFFLFFLSHFLGVLHKRTGSQRKIYISPWSRGIITLEAPGVDQERARSGLGENGC